MYLSSIIAALFGGGTVVAIAAHFLPTHHALPVGDVDATTRIAARRHRVLAITAITTTFAAIALFIVGALPLLAIHAYLLFFLFPTLILGLVFVAVVIAEHLVTTPRGAERVAAMTPRTVGQFLPRVPATMLAATIALGASIPVIGVHLQWADADAPGQTVGYSCPDGQTDSTDLWPGTFYTPWLVAALVLAVVAVAIVFAVVMRRAAHPGMSPAADGHLRTSSLRRALAATTVVIGSQAAMIAAVMTMNLQDMSPGNHCASDHFITWTIIVGTLGALTTLAALAGVFLFFRRETFTPVFTHGGTA